MTEHTQIRPRRLPERSLSQQPRRPHSAHAGRVQEPLARFRREQIQDTVVFFGSARFQGRKAAAQNLATVEKNNPWARPPRSWKKI